MCITLVKHITLHLPSMCITLVKHITLRPTSMRITLVKHITLSRIPNKDVDRVGKVKSLHVLFIVYI